jgi:hypothetical protein
VQVTFKSRLIYFFQYKSKAFFINADKLNQNQTDRSVKLRGLVTERIELHHPAIGHKQKTAASPKSAGFEHMKWFFTPVIAPMLQDRWYILVLTGVCVAQLALTITGFTGWQCPILSTFGVTCPGCGLTTAVVLLLKGHLSLALEAHAFALPVLIALICMAVSSILPLKYRLKAAGRIAAVERHRGIFMILLIGMVLYWFVRI